MEFRGVGADQTRELAALGHQINSTRNTDIFVGLSERAIMATPGADIFISVTA